MDGIASGDAGFLPIEFETEFLGFGEDARAGDSAETFGDGCAFDGEGPDLIRSDGGSKSSIAEGVVFDRVAVAGGSEPDVAID